MITILLDLSIPETAKYIRNSSVSVKYGSTVHEQQKNKQMLNTFGFIPIPSPLSLIHYFSLLAHQF